MKIAIVGHGSRGDAQPPLALASHLLDAGHEVTVCLPGDFTDVVGKLGCRVHALPFETKKELDLPGMTDALKAGHTVRFFTKALENQLPHAAALARAVVDGTEGADLIVGSALVEDLCLSIAEARGKRITFAYPSPIWPNATYPSLLFSGLWIPGFLNPLSHTITEIGIARLLPLVNALRVELGLPAMRRRPADPYRALSPPVFYWLPPQVLPPPADYGSHHIFTGYWSPPPRLRSAWGESVPSPQLVRFLDAGAPPIFVGFGSMPVLDDRLVEMFLEVARSLRRRVVFGLGWSQGIGAHPDACFVDSVDHDWLFPRCAAIVHHGGASTTAAALRSGVPALVLPVFADQPFWGQRVRDLGAGDTFRFQALGPRRLKRGLERVLSPAMHARARVLANELNRIPDGALTTARFITERTSELPVPKAS